MINEEKASGKIIIRGNSKIDSVVFISLLHMAMIGSLYIIYRYGDSWNLEYATQNVFKALIVYAYLVLLILIIYKIEDEVLEKRIQCHLLKKDYHFTDFIVAFLMLLFILSIIFIPIDSYYIDALLMREYSKDHFTGSEYNAMYCALLVSTVSLINSRRSQTKAANKLGGAGQMIGITIGVFIGLIILLYILSQITGIQHFY